MSLVHTKIDDGKVKDDDFLDFEKIVPFPEGFDRHLPAPGPFSVQMLQMSWSEAAKALRAKYEEYAKQFPDGWKDANIPERVKEEMKSFDAYKANLKAGKGCPTWYEWCHENWGTKWGACRTDAPVITEKSAMFTFETAWSPPEPFVRAASKKFPSLTFNLKYWEGGMGFQGQLKMKGGKIIKDVTKDYRGHRGG